MTKQEFTGEISHSFSIEIEAPSIEEAEEKVEELLKDLDYEELVEKYGRFLDSEFHLF